MLDFLEICSNETPVASVIWLHGLGADGYDFEPIVRRFDLPISIRYVLPHAPVIPITLNGGYKMPGWYDIYSLEAGSKQDEAGIRLSEAELIQLIKKENIRGIPTEKIMLAGFSQGGAVALHTAIRYPEKLAGVLALSTYLPLQAQCEAEHATANQSTSIFMAHGQFDEVIKIDRAISSKNALLTLGYTVDWHEYQMAHNVTTDEITDIQRFLTETLV